MAHPQTVPVGSRPVEHSIAHILERRAAESPGIEIYHVVRDDFFASECLDTAALTYADLDRRARAIAATLIERLNPGDRVLLVFNTGLEFMPALFGCMYAGMIPVPVYPPNRGFTLDPLATLRGIRRDCHATAAMTGGSVANGVRKLVEDDDELSSLWWITTETIETARAGDWVPRDISASDIALLQYTSGSTGSPRGVMVTHQNVVSNQFVISHAFAHMARSKPAGALVSWLPFHHDMGLMGMVIQSLFVDVPVYLLSPLDFLRRPLRWLQIISRLGPVTSGAPGFAYDLCCTKVAEEDKALLDLSRWERAFIGADRICPSTIRRFAEAFEPCGFDVRSFYPCYGLAEATLFVTGGLHEDPPVICGSQQANGRSYAGGTESTGPVSDSSALVGCGTTWGDHRVVIVDPDTATECTGDEVGEIWVQGPSIAQGYWNQTQATEATFAALLNGDNGDPFLRTGDLGFIRNNQLFITGRLKDVIIIRGANYHPADIESAVASLDEIFLSASTAAVGRDVDGGEELVVLQEIPRRAPSFDPKSARKDIRQRIAEQFQVQAADIVFLKNGSLPKTSSGKIRRALCRTLYEDGSLQLWKARPSS